MRLVSIHNDAISSHDVFDEESPTLAVSGQNGKRWLVLPLPTEGQLNSTRHQQSVYMPAGVAEATVLKRLLESAPIDHITDVVIADTLYNLEVQETPNWREPWYIATNAAIDALIIPVLRAAR